MRTVILLEKFTLIKIFCMYIETVIKNCKKYKDVIKSHSGNKLLLYYLGHIVLTTLTRDNDLRCIQRRSREGNSIVIRRNISK